MCDFRDCVVEFEIEDINYTDILYTWNGKPHGDNGVLKKLDRVLGNGSFSISFPHVNSIFWSAGISDHSPSVTSFPSFTFDKPRPFKIFNYLSLKDGFHDIVKIVWGTIVNEVPMFSVIRKLEYLKPTLRDPNRK